MITRKTIFKIALLAAGIYAFFGGMLTGIFFTLNKTLPSPRVMEKYTPPLITHLYDENGDVIYEFYEEMRVPVKLTDIPPLVAKTIIAVEDRKFYSHWGIDPLAITRASITNLFTGRLQGASTITQQLARNLFLSFERTYMRKLKEAVLTLQLERKYSKNEIFEMYINEIYFGSGCYGIESAARKFLGKGVKELTLREVALIIGLPRAPLYYNPYKFPHNALKRRAVILNIMKETGIADEAEVERAKNSPLELNTQKTAPRVGPYLVEEVRKFVGERIGSDIFYKGGVSIHTSTSKTLQEIADRVIRDGLEKFKRQYNLKEDSLNPLQAALFAMDPRSGGIKAVVGGRDFIESQFDRATQARRQPGSAFKPFVYTAAVDRGYAPTYKLLDQPIIVEVGDTIYSPSNYDGAFIGEISLRDAIALSRNLASVRLIMEISPELVVRYAKLMGIESKLIPVISLALGSNSVSLKEMVTGYATIANGGYRVKPYIVEKITEGNGRILYEEKPYKERVLRSETAYITASLLSSVMEYGTGAGVKRMGFTRPCFGKTGTTNSWRDAWFIGFTPELICGVWVGYDIPDTIMRGGSGAVAALPIWAEFMKEALSEEPVGNLSIPSGIVKCTVCKESGLLPVEGCPELIEEVFIKGTEPKERCFIHSGRIDFRKLDAESRKERL